MKGLILFVFMLSPAVYAVDNAMSCDQLSRYISGNQYEIMQMKNGSSCAAETLPEFTSAEGRDDAAVSAVISQYGCSPLSVIDETVSKMENEIALVMGIRKLKEDVATNQAQTSDPNTTRAKKAAENFLRALVTARDLEGILNVQSDVPLIRDLKNIPVTQRNTSATFLGAINTLCTRRAGLQNATGTACGQGFTISDEAVGELNDLIDSSELTDQTLSEWSRTLAITKNGGKDSYSFTEMYSDIQSALLTMKSGQVGISRTVLNKIKELPQFQDKYPLSFMNGLAGQTKDMSVNIAFEGARNLVTELRNRQNAQTMSKVSWLLKETQSSAKLTDEQKVFCDQMRGDISKTRLCWNALKSAQMTDVSRGLVDSMTGTIETSLSYLDDLSGADSCLSATNLQKADKGFRFDSDECKKLDIADEVLNEKIARVKALNKLKDKITKNNDRKIKMTNFALNKFTDQCANADRDLVSTRIECPANTSIAPVAETLYTDLLGMAIVRTDKTPPEIAEFCESPEELDVNLCKYIAAPPKNPDSPNRPIPSSSSPYVEVDGHRNDQMNDAIAGAGWAIVNQLQQRPQMMYNPYMNFNPYPYYNPYGSIGGLSPADQILFNARYYGGYGFYTPTYGTTPYTAFPLISPYVQAASYSSTGNTSSYFTNFGTYK